MSKQKRLVLASDLSDDARPAARWAQRFGASEDVEVTLVHVVELSPAHWMTGAFDFLENEDLLRQAEEQLQQWYSEATGGKAGRVEVRAGNAAVQLGEVVRTLGAELLVVARSGKRGWERFMLGSRARALATDPPCDLVVVHPEHDEPKLADIVVGTDFSAGADRAVTVAAGLARRHGAKLHLVHAEEPEPVYAIDALGGAMIPTEYRRREADRAASEHMQGLEQAHADELEGVDYDTKIAAGDPARVLTEACEQNGSDLLVVGRAGHSPLVATVVGSTVNRVLHATPTNLAICPAR